MGSPIVVFCEQRDGRLKKIALEALGAAHRLGEKSGSTVVAVVIGASAGSLAQDIARHGASRLLLAEAPSLALYSSERYASILTDVATRLQPIAVLMGATAMGKDLAPKLAARLKSALMQDCVMLEMEADGSILATRPVYGGKLRAVVKAANPLMQVVTLRSNIFPVLESTSVSDMPIETLTVPTEGARPMATVREVRQTSQGKVELTEAAIIVSGGRGLKGPENFKLVEELAAALGAAVGASRAAVDAGWKPHSYQVGLTGKTVSPQL